MSHLSTNQRRAAAVQPYSNSLSHFCQFIEYYSQQLEDPLSIVAVCEDQAEAVRITRQDVNVETIDMLLDTMLTVINHMGDTWTEAQAQKQWKNRVKYVFQRRLQGSRGRSFEDWQFPAPEPTV
jgi:hypothetical protein